MQLSKSEIFLRLEIKVVKCNEENRTSIDFGNYFYDCRDCGWYTVWFIVNFDRCSSLIIGCSGICTFSPGYEVELEIVYLKQHVRHVAL